MTQTKHAPEKWIYEGRIEHLDGENPGFSIAVDDHYEAIQVFATDVIKAEKRARLIVAAPDNFRQLQQNLTSIIMAKADLEVAAPQSTSILALEMDIKATQIAIAKATGAT